MSTLDDRRLVARAREALAAGLLLSWRAASYPAAGLWRDWVFLLCAFWLFSIFASRTKIWPAVLGALMVGLFALHSAHQAPLTLAVFRSLR
ncbi:MAG TPA: hypothetical protein VM222_07520 [Planctomycetota bacterium]|nr:hypothetical protein [Planctomycetota bacterium]